MARADTERRAHPRYDLTVEVAISQGGDYAALHASNISAGGLRIELAPGEYPGVEIGTAVRVHLDLGSDKYGRPLDLDAEAEVVRVDLGGPGRRASFALMWTSASADVARQLSVILEYLNG